MQIFLGGNEELFVLLGLLDDRLTINFKEKALFAMHSSDMTGISNNAKDFISSLTEAETFSSGFSSLPFAWRRKPRTIPYLHITIKPSSHHYVPHLSQTISITPEEAARTRDLPLFFQTSSPDNSTTWWMPIVPRNLFLSCPVLSWRSEEWGKKAACMKWAVVLDYYHPHHTLWPVCSFSKTELEINARKWIGHPKSGVAMEVRRMSYWFQICILGNMHNAHDICMDPENLNFLLFPHSTFIHRPRIGRDTLINWDVWQHILIDQIKPNHISQSALICFLLPRFLRI